MVTIQTELFAKLELTDKQAARIVGVDVSTANRWKNGSRKISTDDMIGLVRRLPTAKRLAAAKSISGLDGMTLMAPPAKPAATRMASTPARRGCVALMRATAGVAEVVESALEDGVIEPRERELITAAMDEVFVAGADVVGAAV